MSDEYVRNCNSISCIAYHNFDLGRSGSNFKNALGTVGRVMDIVERLREYETWSEDWPIIKEAADEIERLQEEHHDVRILNEQYYNENAILIAEIERLREALKEIADFDTYEDISNEECMRDIARSALQQKDSE